MLEREGRVDETEFASLLKELPLEGCHYECNPVTREWGWKAPKDKVFRISGHFTSASKSEPRYYTYGPPESSAELLKEEYADLYKGFLEKVMGNEERALKSLVEYLNDEKDSYPPLEIPPKFFDGKWLITSFDLGESSQQDEEEQAELADIFVKKEVDAWYEREAYFQIITDLAPESEKVTGCFFRSPIADICWKQDYALAVLVECRIELVDSPDKKKELYIPKTINRREIHIPKEAGKENDKFKQTITVKMKEREDKKQRNKKLDSFAKDNRGFTYVNDLLNENLLIALKRKGILRAEEDDVERFFELYKKKKFYWYDMI